MSEETLSRTAERTTTRPSGGLPGGRPPGGSLSSSSRPQATNLADLLERVLDKGVVIAGDIRVNLLDIELLTIKIRLLVVSVDKAQEMGIDWWRHDRMLSSAPEAGQQDLAEQNRELRERIAALEGAQGTESGGSDADR